MKGLRFLFSLLVLTTIALAVSVWLGFDYIVLCCYIIIGLSKLSLTLLFMARVEDYIQNKAK